MKLGLRKGVGVSLSLAFLAVLLTIGMVIYPKETFTSTLVGLRVWWGIVFPALLPFFVFSKFLWDSEWSTPWVSCLSL